jgi:pimeloyl-ACP methyl ester carboxylesterase
VTEHVPIVDAANDTDFLKRFSGTTENIDLWTFDTGIPRNEEHGTVVFLHSAVGSLGTFKHQFPSFFANGFRVIAYDRRGHGQTPARSDEAKQTPAQQDLNALLDAKGITGPVHLIGAAAGGRLAADFAMSHPQRVASLTLVCSLAGVAAELYPQGTEALLPPEFLALPAYLRELGPVYRGDNPDGTAQWRALVEGEVPKHLVSDPTAWVSRTPVKAPTGARATPAPRGLRRFAWLLQPGAASENGIPLHLITGDADPYTTPSAYARLSQALPQSTFEVVTGAGHSPYWEQPKIFNAMVLKQLTVTTTQGAPA